MFGNIAKIFRWCANAVKALWKFTRLNKPKVLYGFFSSLYIRNFEARQARFSAFDDLIGRVRQEYDTNLRDVEFGPYGIMHMAVFDLDKENKAKFSVMGRHTSEEAFIPCAKGPSLKLIQFSFAPIPTFIREYDANCNIKSID